MDPAVVSSSAQIRAAMVASARWGITANADIHYGEVRPMPLEAWKHRQTPLETDCSGSVTCIAYAAGAPDPNGRGYDGLGFTGTIADHCRHVARAAELLPGDLIGYGDLASTNSHVAMVLEAGDDPLLFSFGGEPGPASIRFSTEVALRRGGGFPVSPITFLSPLPAEPAGPRVWTVTIHIGPRIVKTFRRRTRVAANARVALFALRRPRRWRHVTHVGYDRRAL